MYLYYKVDPLRTTAQTTNNESTHSHDIVVAYSASATTFPNLHIQEATPYIVHDGASAVPLNLPTDTADAHNHGVQFGLVEDSTYTTDNDNVTVEYGATVGAAGAITNTPAAWEASAFHRVDLTPDVRDAGTLRPKNAANVITIEADNTNDGGMITAIIEVRCTIQSITYS